MDPTTHRYLCALVEADDGTFVDGDDVALRRDARDPRVANLGAQLGVLATALRAARRAVGQFQKTAELLVLLPEADPRRLGGLLAEIDIDADVIGQACARLQPRLAAALAQLGPPDPDAPTDWI